MHSYNYLYNKFFFSLNMIFKFKLIITDVIKFNKNKLNNISKIKELILGEKKEKIV